MEVSFPSEEVMEYVEVQRMKRGVVQVDPCRDPNSAGDLGQDDVKKHGLISHLLNCQDGD